MRNLSELEGDWSGIIVKLKQKFEVLTEDDLFLDDDCFLMEGMQEQMLSRLETKLGKKKEEIHMFIYGLLNPVVSAQ